MESLNKVDLSTEGARDLIMSVPIFPYLWVPHAVLMSMALRNTLGVRWHDVSRENPLSCLLIGMLYIYPGGILSSLVLGEPVLSFLLAGPQLYTSLAAWYLVFYCPLDIFYKLIKALRIQPLLFMLQDWQRIGLVMSGIEQANKQTNSSYFIYPVVMGILKSSGFMFIKYLEVGIVNGLKAGFRVPNQATKTMILSAVLIQLQHLYSVFPVSSTDLYCLLVVLAVMLRAVTSILTAADWDPYTGLEKLACAILYGNTKVRPVENGKKKQ